MNEDFFDGMDLPLANAKEELEDISKNKFIPLFDVRKFLVRAEDVKDKGIDHFIELKVDGKHTNFRFAIQLKATETKAPNRDGSISLQIKTANINYLTNGVQLAYYVLYSVKQDTFYYESLNDVVKGVMDKSDQWSEQGTHTIRFNKKLTKEAIQHVYKQCIKHGKLNRNLFERLVFSVPKFEGNEKILIDKDLNVTDDLGILSLIEKAGSLLLNRGESARLIELHEKTSRGFEGSGEYNLHVGIAYYYGGQNLTALNHLRVARRSKPNIDKVYHGHLAYFNLLVEASLAMISEEDFEERAKDIVEGDRIGDYIRLKQIVADYKAIMADQPDEAIANFLKAINRLIESESVAIHVKLLARGERVLIAGGHENMRFIQRLFLLKGVEEMSGPDINNRNQLLNEYDQVMESWQEEFSALLTACKEAENYFGYYLALFHAAKVRYEQLVYINAVPFEPPLVNLPTQERLSKLVDHLEACLQFYSNVNHIENQCAVLSVLYEVQHFAHNEPEYQKVIDQLTLLINTYDLPEIASKLEKLKNGMTTHEVFISQVNAIIDSTNSDATEHANLVAQMQEMDQLDAERSPLAEINQVIELFPIGFFQLPDKDRQDVYQAMNCSTSAIEGIENRIRAGMLPRVNVLDNPIIGEGTGRTHLNEPDIVAWRNVFRIRKYFFDNELFRVVPQ